MYVYPILPNLCITRTLVRLYEFRAVYIWFLIYESETSMFPRIATAQKQNLPINESKTAYNRSFGGIHRPIQHGNKVRMHRCFQLDGRKTSTVQRKHWLVASCMKLPSKPENNTGAMVRKQEENVTLLYWLISHLTWHTMPQILSLRLGLNSDYL